MRLNFPTPKKIFFNFKHFVFLLLCWKGNIIESHQINFMAIMKAIAIKLIMNAFLNLRMNIKRWSAKAKWKRIWDQIFFEEVESLLIFLSLFPSKRSLKFFVPAFIPCTFFDSRHLSRNKYSKLNQENCIRMTKTLR